MCSVDGSLCLFTFEAKQTVPKIYVPINTYKPTFWLEMTPDLRPRIINLLNMATIINGKQRQTGS